jgi:hypothetical protein
MASDTDKQDLVNELRKILQAGWRAALPPSQKQQCIKLKSV